MEGSDDIGPVWEASVVLSGMGRWVTRYVVVANVRLERV